jgi:hypothetical protein
MKHKGLYVLRIYQNLKLFNAVATTNGGFVLSAGAVPTDCVRSDAFSTTWEIPVLGVPVTLWSRTPSTVAQDVIITSMRIWTIWHCPKAIIRTELLRRQCGLSLKMACRIEPHRGIYGETIGYLFRGLRFKIGLKQRGKKSEAAIASEYIDKALADFSGYIAADEIYDGPFCVLFIVDNHTFKRLYYEVLDHNPSNKDITRFFRRFKQILDAHGLTLKGITTDGSPLYPEPIAEVFGKVRHQVCQFHIIKEITKDILKAVTQVRRELKHKKTKRSRGRPSGGKAEQITQKNKQVQKRIAELFDCRYLFAKHSLTLKEKKILQRITRGLDRLRTLRAIMDEIYGLFDRRCRMDTALEKLTRLRRRIRRFTALTDTLKKLSSPNLEKALMFLDDSLLPSTSNAVERANRRHRKMQKSIYRVRTREHISRRIAADMQRDVYAVEHNKTMDTLHWSRTGEKRKAG